MKNKNKDLSLDTSILLTTGAMAKALGVNQRTLMIWDKEKILVPVRSETNRRFYNLKQVDEGKAILFVTKNLFLDLGAVKLLHGIFEKENIESEQQLKYLKEIAKIAGFTEKLQKNNIEKYQKRGVKKKTDKKD